MGQRGVHMLRVAGGGGKGQSVLRVERGAGTRGCVEGERARTMVEDIGGKGASAYQGSIPLYLNGSRISNGLLQAALHFSVGLYLGSLHHIVQAFAT